MAPSDIVAGEYKMRKNGGKNKYVILIAAVVLVVGLALMLYPAVADYVNSLSFHAVIKDYQSRVEAMDSNVYERLLAEAKEYNEELFKNVTYIASLDEATRERYNKLLDIMDNGIMGYIEIPSAKINLPIYHGTDDGVLRKGVGHLEGSSLPIGGENTYSILTSHRGLPSAKLFSDIDKLKVGDTFMVHVLGEVLTYEVDDISTVLPEELTTVRIEGGKDICTLMTCTPYGVNTHRLLVRGHRIENHEPDEQPSKPSSPVIIEDFEGWNPKLLAVPAAVVLAAVIILLVAGLGRSKRKKNNQQNENGGNKS